MKINYGDIFRLGNHRLMCGDATNRDDVYKLIEGFHVNLVLTDPPYGMKCQDKKGEMGGQDPNNAHERVAQYFGCIVSGTKKERLAGAHINTNVRPKAYPLLIGDDNQDAARNNYNIIKDISDKQIIWGGQYFAHFLPISGAWIFWDKLTGDTDFSDGELAWVSKGKRIRKYVHMWNGVIRAGKKNLNLRQRVHPNQKPVELHIKILEDFSKENDVILDCFGGSGTTLIASECCNRKCLMMEISPEYCEIIINRYIKLNELVNKVEKEV